MADPKYADLPGIAYDQPDVYETSDLPESEQNEYYEEESESIERLHISANEAFTKFKGKSLHALNVDFSDRLSKTRRIGYDARSGEWELAEVGEKETPLQKYHRLQCEMQELSEEVNQLKETAKEDKNQEEMSCALLSSQVEAAQKYLSELRLEETLGSELLVNLADPQGTQLRKLLAQIESFKQRGGTVDKSGKRTEIGQDKPQDVITYQVNFWPEQTNLAQTSRIANLEQRLHKLEAVLGASSDKMSRLALDTQHKCLLEVAQQLSARASLLDSAQLDHIEGRLIAMTQKMDSIAEKAASSPEDAERNRKINELYDLVKKTETLSQILPQTQDRLLALESLHKQAVDFKKSLLQLEALQQQIIVTLQNNEALLKGVQDSFKQNMDSIQKNMKTLESRITQLNKK